ncbi:MAG: hypothetical protein MUD01_29135 [Chloroflexaceae bacterium]|nr:hypothetical protein [Chloroflexaceae bacterium]
MLAIAPWAVLAAYNAPIQAVAIQQIIGSTQRPGDFDRNFAPLKRTDKKRWQQLAVALQLGEELAPVKLIKYGAVYYVQDGHLRISVARASGYDYVDTIVHEVKVAEQDSAYQANCGPEYVCPQCSA